MAYIIDIVKLSDEEANAAATGDGAGNWGVSIPDGCFVGWQCPMAGDGGDSADPSTLSDLLARYNTEADFDPSEGPDEIVFVSGGDLYLATISIQ